MRRYDVVVVGAGVAGTIASREFARRGLDVLLVERERFPRTKVCGGCLGAVALATLESVGLGALPARLGAVPVSHFDWCAGSQRARVPLGGGVIVSRATLDAALLQAAREAGVTVREGVRASWSGESIVELGERERVEAGLVVLATGLGGGTASRGSLVGAGAVFDSAAIDLDAGVIQMTHGREGYVGIASAEAGCVLAAAALRDSAIRSWTIEGAVHRILSKARRPLLPSGAAWKGTPLLTRSVRQRSAHHVVRIGDAAGYVEPFTGEGMGWAMRGAAWLGQRWCPNSGEDWQARLDALLAPSRRRCRMVTGALRVPGVAPAAVAALRTFPDMVRTTSAWVSPS